MLLQEAKIVVSSAKTIDFECFKQLGISLISIKNSNGPRTDPCGTPQVIYCLED